MLFLYTLQNRTPGVAIRLAKKLGTKILPWDTIPLTLKRGDIIFNYGASTPPKWKNITSFMDIKVLNHWDNVKRSVNKISSLNTLRMENVPTINFTTNKTEALEYKRVVVRKLICSTKAKGILVIDNPTTETLPTAPLYTDYFKKTHEFRVHVFNGQVIDYTQKKMLSLETRKKRGITPIKYIRSYDNGWIFSRNNIIESQEVKDLAIRATAAMGLDFCGVDILSNFKDENTHLNSVVCETNSAPGMINTTLNKYLTTLKLIQHGN